ncbi:hypothetical protein [Chitinimonas sp.]|uniref:hypothetical protein n=1 Tax=Chitinimonas sp. TaxID=1934313 RepID=UPI0035B30A4E
MLGRLAILLLLACLLLHGSAVTRHRHPALDSLPTTMLWAWDRPEDLRWLNDADTGVAYLAASVILRGDAVQVTPRRPGLQVNGRLAVIPVVHIDAWRGTPGLNAAQRDAIVDAVLAVAGRGNRRVVQLDFEARRSQRAFLAELVQGLRARLPSDTALSMTALASWCAGDYWLASIEADEIVPMAFRMANDDAAIRSQLATRGRFTAARCQDAIGLSLDEPPITARAGRY